MSIKMEKIKSINKGSIILVLSLCVERGKK